MSILTMHDLADRRLLDAEEMRRTTGGKGENKEVYIFSSEILTILGQHDLARFRKLEEQVQNSGHHE